MSLFDTHTHLYLADSFENPAATVRNAIDAGVTQMVFPGINASSIEPMRTLHSIFPENTHIAAGLHPTDVKPETWKEELDIISRELKERRNDYVAVGEVGIDLYWDNSTLDIQQQALEFQCDLAAELNLPVIIHCRDGFEATFEVLEGRRIATPVVFHSFSGDIPVSERILSNFPDSYFGINGIVTFKNSRLKEVLEVIPDNKLLIETDSPYLAPVPKRGRTNESAYLVYTAAFIAGEKGMTNEDFARLTTENANRFFNLSHD